MRYRNYYWSVVQSRDGAEGLYFFGGGKGSAAFLGSKRVVTVALAF
jgi:hypothetical protein